MPLFIELTDLGNTRISIDLERVDYMAEDNNNDTRINYVDLKGASKSYRVKESINSVCEMINKLAEPLHHKVTLFHKQSHFS